MAAVSLGTIQSQAHAEERALHAVVANQNEIALDMQAAELEEAFAFVDSIPTEIVETYTDKQLATYLHNLNLQPGISTRANVLGCSAAITTAIAGAAFPAFKIAKIVRIIKKLGGPRATAEKIKQSGGLIKITKERADEDTVTGMLASLAAELSGISGIRENCF
ncbi:hypothetical protein [Corynebacterium pseudodiphtheriticum]|uniref:hypothetical protein n=1 Tax=Corynebacterium pseudodiphtheriticum TaxID=37637 RepID=UPI000F86570E|nr:hypothetical protein [Corynebacterium pseudodiphtheriticum]RUP93434.1 hypothetical protein D8M19_04950 [Corynebacterium pseudodiphtheriticum]